MGSRSRHRGCFTHGAVILILPDFEGKAVRELGEHQVNGLVPVGLGKKLSRGRAPIGPSVGTEVPTYAAFPGVWVDGIQSIILTMYIISPVKGPPHLKKCSTWSFFLHHTMSSDL